jgi:hypothetical protein
MPLGDSGQGPGPDSGLPDRQTILARARNRDLAQELPGKGRTGRQFAPRTGAGTIKEWTVGIPSGEQGHGARN